MTGRFQRATHPAAQVIRRRVASSGSEHRYAYGFPAENREADSVFLIRRCLLLSIS